MANLLSWLGGVANDIGGQFNNAAGAVNNFAVRPIQQAQNQAIRNVQRVAQPIANNFAEQAKRTELYRMQQNMARANNATAQALRQGIGNANNTIGFGIKVAQAVPGVAQNSMRGITVDPYRDVRKIVPIMNLADSVNLARQGKYMQAAQNAVSPPILGTLADTSRQMAANASNQYHQGPAYAKPFNVPTAAEINDNKMAGRIIENGGNKVIGAAQSMPGVNNVLNNKIVAGKSLRDAGGFVNESIIKPTLYQANDLGEAIVGSNDQKRLDKLGYTNNLKGAAKLAYDTVSVASLAYTGTKAAQLAKTPLTKLTPGLVANVAARQGASGVAQNTALQLSQGKNFNELDPKEMALAGLTYAGLGTGTPLLGKVGVKGAQTLIGAGKMAIGRKAVNAIGNQVNLQNTLKKADIQPDVRRVGTFAEAGRLQAQGIPAKVDSSMAPVPLKRPVASAVTAENFVRDARGKYAVNNKVNPELDQLKSYQADQVKILSNTPPTSPTHQGAIKNYQAAQQRIDTLSKSQVNKPINELAPQTNPEVLLKKAGYKLDKNGDWIDPTGKPADIGEMQQVIQPKALTQAEQKIAMGKETVAQTQGLENKLAREGAPIYETAPTPNKIPEIPAKKDIITETPGPIRSGLSKSMEAKGYKSSTFDDIPGYSKVTNESMLAESNKVIKQDEQGVLQGLLNRKRNEPITAQQNADAIALMNKLAKEGRDEELSQLAKATAPNATEAGRAVQILSRLQALTPEGALVRANKIISKYNDKFSKTNKDIVLSKENETTIIKMAKAIEKLQDGTREHDIASARLVKYIDELVPASKLAKLSSIQTMAQLMNPKTAIRNIVGNEAMALGEDVSTSVAAPVDRLVTRLQKMTGHEGAQRTTAIINPMDRIKGTWEGGKYGLSDAKEGIKTSGLAGNFEITTDVFRGARKGDNMLQAAARNGMKGAQTLLSIELGAMDKAFYNGQFKTSLGSMMKANKVKKPEKWMLQQADAEALYSTFQNNGKIAQALSGTKKWLNLNKEWGLGDMIVKYPKTPGNIVQVGIDYTPVGAMKGLYSLVNNWGHLDKVTQREAVKNIGRGITGSGIIGVGAMLAAAGVITGKKSTDKDMAAIDRQQGDGPFTFNFTALQRLLAGQSTKAQAGDVIANYDWMQPSAISLSMGANAVLNGGAKQKKWENVFGDALEALGDSVNTVAEQPVVTGLTRFINTASNTNYGGGVGNAFANIFQGIPSSFTPGIINQAGQLRDNVARSTYDPNYFKTGLNQIKARIPGLRETLQPRIDTMGKTQEQYSDGSNNVFNVFFNPAFVRTFKTSPAYDLVNSIFEKTGDQQQAPRVTSNQVTINGQKRDLTSEESKQYQEYVGKLTSNTFNKMGTDPAFLALPDSEKASRMASAMTDINSVALYDLFGNRPKTFGVDQRRILSSGEVGYSTSEDGSKTAANPKERYQIALDKYNQDKKDGLISDVKDITEQKSLAKLKAQANFDQDTNDLYGLSNKQIDEYLKTKQNGGTIFNKLLALDDAMVATGATSKFRDKYGKLKVLNPVKVASAKKGKKGKKKSVAQLPNLVKSGMFGSSKIVAKGTPSTKLSVKSLPKVNIGKTYA